MTTNSYSMGKLRETQGNSKENAFFECITKYVHGSRTDDTCLNGRAWIRLRTSSNVHITVFLLSTNPRISLQVGDHSLYFTHSCHPVASDYTRNEISQEENFRGCSLQFPKWLLSCKKTAHCCSDRLYTGAPFVILNDISGKALPSHFDLLLP